MKSQLKYLSIIISAILITALFYQQRIGLNLMIFEFIFLLFLMISKQLKWSRNMLIGTVGIIISALSTVITHSAFSITFNLIAFVVWTGLVIYPEARSILNSFYLAWSSMILSQYEFWKAIGSSQLFGNKLGRILWKSRIFIAPIGIILIFITIYSFSNPVFNNITTSIGKYIENTINLIIKDWNISLIFTFIFALFISIFLFVRSKNNVLISSDEKANDQLLRRKKKSWAPFNYPGLKNELKSGIFLLGILNLLIFILNIIDINGVWLNFEWEGQFLKSSVHEGTYLLIISILISMAVVLYFFRGNLNFYRKNKWLRYLSYTWIIQNLVLTLSVAIRNFRYIHYFSLAYLRIGVIIFLILVIIGLVTIFIKVRSQKSTFFLLKWNALSMYLILLISSAINWDAMIARHNFSNYDHAFVHLNYLSTLPDRTLPYLDHSMDELLMIHEQQTKQFPFMGRYLTPEQYYQIIQDRKDSFIYRYEHQNWLAWNLPDYLAYQKLKNQ